MIEYEYERKSCRITTPILSRNCWIIAEDMLSFSMSSATPGSLEFRAGDEVWSSKDQRLEKQTGSSRR